VDQIKLGKFGVVKKVIQQSIKIKSYMMRYRGNEAKNMEYDFMIKNGTYTGKNKKQNSKGT